LRLVMAVSANGYLATGPNDDMSWTGLDDKQVFRLLTSVGGPLLAGRLTAEKLPNLHHRSVIPVSKGQLHDLSVIYPDAWLIGGSTIAYSALRTGYVKSAWMCHSEKNIQGTSAYYADHLTPTFKDFGWGSWTIGNFGNTMVVRWAPGTD
jgi:dihydrofolate reductase